MRKVAPSSPFPYGALCLSSSSTSKCRRAALGSSAAFCSVERFNFNGGSSITKRSDEPWIARELQSVHSDRDTTGVVRHISLGRVMSPFPCCLSNERMPCSYGDTPTRSRYLLPPRRRGFRGNSRHPPTGRTGSLHSSCGSAPARRATSELPRVPNDLRLATGHLFSWPENGSLTGLAENGVRFRVDRDASQGDLARSRASGGYDQMAALSRKKTKNVLMMIFKSKRMDQFSM